MQRKMMNRGTPPLPRAALRQRTPVTPAQVSEAVRRARAVCVGERVMCAIAWEEVEELSSELARQREAPIVLSPLQRPPRLGL